MRAGKPRKVRQAKLLGLRDEEEEGLGDVGRAGARLDEEREEERDEESHRVVRQSMARAERRQGQWMALACQPRQGLAIYWPCGLSICLATIR